MTFRDEVQKSPEVQFAMDIFHALNSNNFVRFFRLLRYALKILLLLLFFYLEESVVWSVKSVWNFLFYFDIWSPDIQLKVLFIFNFFLFGFIIWFYLAVLILACFLTWFFII